MILLSMHVLISHDENGIAQLILFDSNFSMSTNQLFHSFINKNVPVNDNSLMKGNHFARELIALEDKN